MKKDPAFLFMSKDWLTGTAEMLPEEKGVYIDLLAYQHQNGSLPTDKTRLAKLIGITQRTFDKIWLVVSKHFYEENGRLFNKKLQEIIKERADKGLRNKIIGTFASVIRLHSLNKKEYQYVRKCFNVDEWLNIDSESITERLTEWLQERLKSIGNGNGNGDGNEDENINSEYLRFVKLFDSYKREKYPDLMIGIEINEMSCAKVVDELIRIDGFSLDHIKDVVRWSLTDDFWSKQIKSIASLRNKSKNGLTKFVNLRSAYLEDKPNETKKTEAEIKRLKQIQWEKEFDAFHKMANPHLYERD